MISESELLAEVPNQLFIGGEWVDAEAAETLDVRDPARHGRSVSRLLLACAVFHRVIEPT